MSAKSGVHIALAGNLVKTYLEVVGLRHKPVVDEGLWVTGESQHEVTTRLQLIHCLHGLVDLQQQQHT